MNIQNNKKIAFLGGDMRSTVAAMKLADTAWDVFAWSVPERRDAYGVCFCNDMLEAILGASALILPLPSSLDGVSLNHKTREDEQKITLSEIVDKADKNSIIVGGKIPKTILDRAQGDGIGIFDYFDSESFQIRNAYTTAEAALNIAMNNLLKNVRDASFVITGYGRIAKQLSRLLLALGADVTVAARKDSDLALAEIEGAKILKLGKEPISRLCTGHDVIFNTVPHCIFDESFLRRLDPDTLFIELASSPGGVDVSLAKRLKANVLWASSLPGKYAPYSAGELIADCVRDILEVEVVK